MSIKSHYKNTKYVILKCKNQTYIMTRTTEQAAIDQNFKQNIKQEGMVNGTKYLDRNGRKLVILVTISCLILLAKIFCNQRRSGSQWLLIYFKFSTVCNLQTLIVCFCIWSHLFSWTLRWIWNLLHFNNVPQTFFQVHNTWFVLVQLVLHNDINSSIIFCI